MISSESLDPVRERATLLGEEKSSKTKTRIDYIDIARGIAIILMVVGHCIAIKTKWTWQIRKIIFSFHMPFFIIVSGMFFKENRKLTDIIVNSIKKLLIPYEITIIVTNIILNIFLDNSMTVCGTIKQIIVGYAGINSNQVAQLWFIPFLIASQIIFYILKKISKQDDLLLGIMCTVISMLGIYLGKKHIFLVVWSFDITLACIVFYYIGYIFNKFNLFEKILNNKKIIFLIILTYIVGMLFDHIEIANRTYPEGFTCYVTAVCGSLIVLKISKLIEIFSKILTKILKWYGKNSIYVLCLHYMEYRLIDYSKLGLTRRNRNSFC